MATQESKRLVRLRQGFEASLGKWQKILTEAVSGEEYKRAYRETDGKYPTIRSRVTGDGGAEGVLPLVIQAEFPILNREMPDALRDLIAELLDKVNSSSKAEFELVLNEYGLAEKFLRLEQMEDDLKRAQADGTAEMPPPLAMSPEDELRTSTMEIKLNYQRALEKELEKLRSANAEAETEVTALDVRAKRVMGTVESRAAVIARLAAIAESQGLLLSGDDAGELDDAEGGLEEENAGGAGSRASRKL